MDLKTFVAETLCQIQQGVQEAINRRSEEGGEGVINPHYGRYDEETKEIVEKVQFDVAVTVSEGEEKEGRAGLRVLSVGLDGAAKGSKASETVSRVQFAVRIVPPVTKVDQDRSRAMSKGMADALKPKLGTIA